MPTATGGGITWTARPVVQGSSGERLDRLGHQRPDHESELPGCRLNATIETPEFNAWLTNLQTGTYDASIGWGTEPQTVWDVFRGLVDSSFITPEGVANAQLWSRWTSRRLTSC